MLDHETQKLKDLSARATAIAGEEGLYDLRTMEMMERALLAELDLVAPYDHSSAEYCAGLDALGKLQQAIAAERQLEDIPLEDFRAVY